MRRPRPRSRGSGWRSRHRGRRAPLRSRVLLPAAEYLRCGAGRTRPLGTPGPSPSSPRRHACRVARDSLSPRMTDARAVRIVLDADRRLAERIRALAGQRMVFFAGLPGTGKSLLAHQLVHLASTAGRRVHLLQWDVARPVFEAIPAGQRYPLVDGVTHPVIRRAVGLWAREALIEWNSRYHEVEHLLVGETPFVGNRFVELARPMDDRAEALLTEPACRF